MTTTPFDARVAALDADALAELMRGRHSVRAFTDRPIEGTAREALEAQVAAENERAGLSMQLCLDAPGAFDGRLAHYGSFRNVRNHLALVGPSGPELDEAVGYAGEKVVLLARALGVDSCWVALTYDRGRSPARVGAGGQAGRAALPRERRGARVVHRRRGGGAPGPDGPEPAALPL